ncbi:MAG TPA: M14 metallopeptidase family protein [Pyrinomonadaceae bacterium]|nr:M14 metallopeptidase family protein [Pyrinomonadaceae bacterium]
MHKRLSIILVALLLIALSIQSDAILPRPAALAQGISDLKRIPAPAAVLGFTPGDDRKLASWAKVVEYFQKLAATSDRVKFEETGKSTMGRPFVYATISAPENLKRLDEFKEIQRQLADPRLLGSPTNPALADRRARALIARGKTVIAITCGIHSTEVGSYLSSMLIAYRLASSNEPEIQEILKNTIILLVPSTNPDGVDIVNNWYQKTLGTPYEGTDPPELYHKYTGHDDNRDWYAFTQVETQLVVDKILNVWHPQIVHDIHQQGAFGSRLFLPPYMQPVEPNVPKQIVEGYTELGNYIAKEMRGAGFKGITTDSTYDAWSPSRAYSHYHGGVRILSETASCRLATPITVKFDQLRPGEGYDPRKEAANFGPVWQGGEWHIRDITNTMTTVAFFLLKHAAQNREHWLQRFYEIEKEAVRPRKAGELQGFEIIGKEGDPVLLRNILNRGGVQVDYGHPRTVPSGNLAPISMYVHMAQPYGSFAKALLESQHYPDLRDPAGRPIAPYDVTAHSLPLLMAVEVKPIYSSLRYKKVLVDEAAELNYFSRGSRVAIYKSHVPAIDEGWTRWVFEQNGVTTYPYDAQGDQRTNPLGTGRSAPFSSLMDAEARNGKLSAKYDTIIIPDQPRAAILNGYRAGAMPPEYTGGLGAEGVKALHEFVEQGGTLVCLNRASDFAIEQFKLPVRDVVDGLPRTDFYVPGSILRIELDTSDPIAAGMPKESIAWAENSPVFELVRTGSGSDRVDPSNVHVIAWYPKDKDPLLSGWLLGGERIKGKAALVEVGMGKGRIILFGFRPQYRGQSLATYPLFFNAITSR